MGGLGSTLGIDAEALLDAFGEVADEARTGWYVVLLDTNPAEVIPVNETAKRLLCEGRRDIWDCVAPEERSRMAERLADRQARKPTPDVYETVLVDAAGQRVPSEVSNFDTVINGRRATIVSVLDVSARSRAAAALAKSEAQFRNVVESAPDGVAILRNGQFVYVNRPAATMLGCQDPEQVVGMALSDLLQPAEVNRAHSRIGAMLRTGQRHGTPAEYTSRGLDGREILIEISSIPIEFEGAPAVLGFARNVTERRAMQERLLQADRLAAVGTLAAGVAHEINNPLAYAVLSLEVARRDLAAADLPKAVREHLDQRLDDALHGTNRVATIVRDLKIFARPTDTERVLFDVNEVVRSALRVTHNELRHHAEIETRLECQCQVHGSPLRLEQAILNLLVNAAQAMDPAAVRRNTISITTSGEEVAQIVIADNGPGIDPDALPQIFDPFFTTKPPGVGTGLGLPTCRSIVEWHGGTISVTSDQRTGTRFVVTLPRAPCELVRAAPKPDTERPPPAKGTRLLVVDDEPALCAALQASLCDDFAVTHATSGEEALALVDVNDFDVVLCDVMMPAMGGLEFHARLQQRQPELAKRVVFMTGGVFAQTVDDQLDRMGNPLLAKPFRPNDVRRVVSALLAS